MLYHLLKRNHVKSEWLHRLLQSHSVAASFKFSSDLKLANASEIFGFVSYLIDS